MEIKHLEKPSFFVIGKEGSTEEGQGFIQRLWKEANEHYEEVKELAQKDEKGRIAGYWGAMTSLKRDFKPWEDNFTKGLYLAGVEAKEEAQAPEGWTKWKIPGYEYLYTKVEDENTFSNMITYIKENDLQLVGAVHDFTSPIDGLSYMFFPIRKL